MLTAPEITSDRQPVKRDFNDLDSLINELNTPKESIQPSRPAGSALNTVAGSTDNEIIDLEQPEPIPAEIAALSGKVIASTIDTALSTGLSLYAKGGTAEKYEASDKQMENLKLAWSAVAQKYNYRVEDSPWFNVILLNVAVYFPTFKEAQKDRRFAEVDEAMKEMNERLKLAEAKLKAAEPQTAA